MNDPEFLAAFDAAGVEMALQESTKTLTEQSVRILEVAGEHSVITESGVALPEQQSAPILDELNVAEEAGTSSKLQTKQSNETNVIKEEEVAEEPPQKKFKA